MRKGIGGAPSIVTGTQSSLINAPILAVAPRRARNRHGPDDRFPLTPLVPLPLTPSPCRERGTACSESVRFSSPSRQSESHANLKLSWLKQL